MKSSSENNKPEEEILQSINNQGKSNLESKNTALEDNSYKFKKEITNDRMANDSEISLESKLGDFELISQDSLLLMDRNDSVYIKLPEAAYYWKFKFVFAHNDKVSANVVAQKILEDKTIELTLNNFYDPTWVETVQNFISINKLQELQVLIRTTATLNQNRRHVIITIWKKKTMNPDSLQETTKTI
jgi:hypothetical protein